MTANAFPRRASFVIPGDPIGKGRPRFSRGRTYTPARTIEYEQVVAATAHPAMPEPFTGPIRLTLHAWFAVPASLPKAKAAARMATRHTQRPDIDNLAKSIADGLNGIAYADDCQVAEITVTKFWGPVGKVEVVVEELSQ